jgi:hypothetical protein
MLRFSLTPRGAAYESGSLWALTCGGWDAGGVGCSAVLVPSVRALLPNEARVRGNGLPSACTSHKHVGEPKDDVITSTFELARPASSTCHHRRVTEHARPYLVDLYIVDLVNACLKYLGQDSRSIARTPVRPGNGPFGRNDPLERRSISAEPSPRQILLQCNQRGFALRHCRPRGTTRHCQSTGDNDQGGAAPTTTSLAGHSGWSCIEHDRQPLRPSAYREAFQPRRRRRVARMATLTPIIIAKPRPT